MESKKMAANLHQDFSCGQIGQVLAALLVMIAAACADSPAGDAQHALVRDSAGIRIVENDPPDDALPLWSLADTPDLVIGTRAGDELFALNSVNEALFLSDGRILVRNSGFELLWFDATGTFLARGGGSGEGPSESRYLVRVEITGGDSVIAVSKKPPSLKVFGPDGEFVRSVAIPPLPSIVAMGRLGALGWAGIGFGGEFAPARAEVFHELYHVVRFTPDLIPSDTLLALDGNTFYGDRRDFVSVPGGSRGHFAVGADVVVAGSSATYELKVFGAGGELRHIIRNSIPSPAELRLVGRARTGPDRPSEGGGPRRTLEPPEVEAAPAYDWVFVANDGAVWVRHLAGPDEESVRTDIAWSSAVSSSSGPLWVAEGLQGQEWHVYDQEGVLFARALLPPRFRPTEITASRVLGVWEDELGVESVRVFRLIRS